ncbi:MAG: 2-oxoacid:ferredoxin oxidoreductase subunit beta [Nitrospinae bacterium]|nr:2-oxoacid:ferredoxin oxidoreductase subunit beta [Nitrospinota bacterium]
MATGIYAKGKEYKSEVPPTWCAGCGDYGLLNAFMNSLADQQINVNNTALISGIGCSSRFPFFIKAYGFHGVHGRALTIASGVKLANPELEVVAFGGDGDGFAIGGGHVPHMCRKNMDMTYIVMDNSIYGLTKGQMSPTTTPGMKTSTTPYGAPDNPINPLAFVLTYGATFVAQAFSGNPKQMRGLITQAMKHRGFSYINVISPCPTFNKQDTFDSYKEMFEDLPEDHDTSDKPGAIAKALDRTSGKLYSGVYYEDKETPTFLDRIAEQRKTAGAFDFQKILDIYRP